MIFLLLICRFLQFTDVYSIYLNMIIWTDLNSFYEHTVKLCKIVAELKQFFRVYDLELSYLELILQWALTRRFVRRILCFKIFFIDFYLDKYFPWNVYCLLFFPEPYSDKFIRHRPINLPLAHMSLVRAIWLGKGILLVFTRYGLHRNISRAIIYFALPFQPDTLNSW